jgi:hypothetical protein
MDAVSSLLLAVHVGDLICAFLNGFIFYPVYCWWLDRKQSRVAEPPLTTAP